MHNAIVPAEPVMPTRARQVFAGFATGVAVVAAVDNGRIRGLSVTSLTAVSLDPPLVSVAIARTSTTWPFLRRAPHWGISVLGQAQGEALDGMRRSSARRFDGVDMQVVGDAAYVRGALATLSVVVEAEVAAGDHLLVLLRVLEARRDEAQHPLVYFGGDAHEVAVPTHPKGTR